MKHNTLKNSLILAALVFSMTGCFSDNSTLSEGVSDNSSAATPETPDTPDTETPETPQTPEPPGESVAKDATPLWEAKVSAGKEWTSHVNKALDSLGQDLLDVVPADRSLFCPNYANLSYAQRKQYWAFMLSAMVRFESNFKPETSYTESFDDSNGNNVVSRGLLQISIESGNAYGCGFKTSKDLHDPYQNLSCGIRILNRWVGRDGRIAGKVDSSWRGGARYWSVLRAGDKTSYQSILKWSKELSFCK
ncbi:Transglycosylase SLT domain protein [compost metagenome]